MSRFDLLIHWEIDAIERLLDEVPPFLSEHAKHARLVGRTGFLPNGRLSEEEVYLTARVLIYEAIIYHLNAVVDWVLLALATRILPPEWGLTPQAQSMSRVQLIKAIESRYDVALKQLPRWNQIEELRKAANALKHRGGSHLPEPSSLGIPVFHQVDIRPESLKMLLAGTREWLLHLWDSTEGGGNLDSA